MCTRGRCAAIRRRPLTGQHTAQACGVCSGRMYDTLRCAQMPWHITACRHTLARCVRHTAWRHGGMTEAVRVDVRAAALHLQAMQDAPQTQWTRPLRALSGLLERDGRSTCNALGGADVALVLHTALVSPGVDEAGTTAALRCLCHLARAHTPLAAAHSMVVAAVPYFRRGGRAARAAVQYVQALIEWAPARLLASRTTHALWDALYTEVGCVMQWVHKSRATLRDAARACASLLPACAALLRMDTAMAHTPTVAEHAHATACMWLLLDKHTAGAGAACDSAVDMCTLVQAHTANEAHVCALWGGVRHTLGCDGVCPSTQAKALRLLSDGCMRWPAASAAQGRAMRDDAWVARVLQEGCAPDVHAAAAGVLVACAWAMRGAQPDAHAAQHALVEALADGVRRGAPAEAVLPAVRSLAHTPLAPVLVGDGWVHLAMQQGSEEGARMGMHLVVLLMQRACPAHRDAQDSLAMCPPHSVHAAAHLAMQRLPSDTDDTHRRACGHALHITQEFARLRHTGGYII